MIIITIKDFSKLRILYLAILLFSFESFAYSFQGINKIIEKGELTVSFTPNDTAIFTIVDKNNNLTGIDVDIAKLIAKELGVKLKITKTASDWNSVIDEVNSQKADIGISYLSITSDRSKKVLFSNPYVQNRQVLLFNNLSLEYQRAKGREVIFDMFQKDDGMHLATFTGSSYESFAKELFPDIKLSTFDSTQELISNLLDRKIDAILVDEIELYALFQKNPGLKIKLSEVVLKDNLDAIAIAIDPENIDLLFFINNILKSKQINYTVRSAYETYKQRGYK